MACHLVLSALTPIWGQKGSVWPSLTLAQGWAQCGLCPQAREPSGAVSVQLVPGEEGDGHPGMLAWLV